MAIQSSNPFPSMPIANYGEAITHNCELEYMHSVRPILHDYVTAYPDSEKRLGVAIGIGGDHGSGKTHLLTLLADNLTELDQRAVSLYARTEVESSAFYKQIVSQLSKDAISNLIDLAKKSISADHSGSKEPESLLDRLPYLPPLLTERLMALSDPLLEEESYLWLMGERVQGLGQLDENLQLDALLMIAALHRLAGLPLLILIDELEVILQTSDRARPVSIFKRLLESFISEHALVFIAGIDEVWQEFPRDALDRFSRPPLRLGNLRAGETSKLLNAYTGGVNDFTEEAVAAIHELSKGNPREIIRIAHHAFEKHDGDLGASTRESILKSAIDSRILDDQPELKLRPKGERVRTIADAPEVVDRLGRQPLAESLATRLRRMYDEDPGNSFLLHIDGPWGAGKSTLLNFLRRELVDDWLVVNFNAWREQRSGPPWWALLTALRRSAYHRFRGLRRLWIRISQFLARLRGIGVGYVLSLLVTASVTVGLLLWLADGNFSITKLGSVAKSLAAIIGLVLTVWQANVALSRRILPGSPKNARAYIDANTDPMQGIAVHFQTFINRVKLPVVIFIDDLDRCREEYVVEFLEAVQTLIREEPRESTMEDRDQDWLESSREDRNGDQFASEKAARKAPYFVVAADGRWIRASYEKAYSTFVDEVKEPGRPLGYLFLDKAF